MKVEARVEEGEKGSYEFFDDALVDENRNGDAEDTNKSEVAASPTEIEFEILSCSAPILNEFVLVCFHSSTHLQIRSNNNSPNLSFSHPSPNLPLFIWA